MSNTIFFCSTYYHVFSTVVSVLYGNRNNLYINLKPDIVITDYIPNGQKLLPELNSTKLFSNIIMIYDIKEYEATTYVDKLFFRRKRNIKCIQNQLKIDIQNYNDIYIYHDDTWIAHFLKDSKIEYILAEDGLDYLKYIDSTCFKYMLPQSNLRTKVKKLIGLKYRYLLESKQVKLIEVNDIINLKIKSDDRIIVKNKKDIYNRLTKYEKQLIYNIFSPAINLSIRPKSVLVLTQPLYEDNIVNSYEKQIEIYKNIISIYQNEYNIDLKPHPRDNCDYSKIGNIKILPKNFPFEIMILDNNYNYEYYLTINSTALNLLPREKVISYGINFVMKHIY